MSTHVEVQSSFNDANGLYCRRDSNTAIDILDTNMCIDDELAPADMILILLYFAQIKTQNIMNRE